MNKFVMSSSDATKYSMTFKGMALSLLPLFLLLTGLTEAEMTPIIDTITNIIFVATSLIASVQILYGSLRKIKLGRWSAKTE